MFNCQFQRVVNQFFNDYSRVVAKWPLPFLVVPLLLTAVLTVGFLRNIEHLSQNLTTGQQQLSVFLPERGWATRDLRRLATLFPPRDALRDNYDLFGATYAYVIVEDASRLANVLRENVLRVVGDVDARVRSISVGGYDYERLCFRDVAARGCLAHPIMNLLNSSDPLPSVSFFLDYPLQAIGDQTIDNSLIFGSVTLAAGSGGGRVARAAALRIPYMIGQLGSEEQVAAASAWQGAFLDMMRALRVDGVTLYYSTSLSWPQEVERNGFMILPFMPALCVVLVVFSVVSCLSADWVAAKPWLAVCGLLNALFAILATMGALMHVGYPFLTMVFIMPFLILSISVDNMFLMLNGFRTTDCRLSVEDRMAEAIGSTAVSILITTLTDGLSFSIGSMSDFAAVRIFCTYCALAVLFVFLYQMTFFCGCLALTGRREASGRHSFTCAKAVPAIHCCVFTFCIRILLHTGTSVLILAQRSWWYKLFCSGGDHLPVGAETRRSFTDHLIDVYSDFLNLWATQAFVLLCYVFYIGGAVYGVLQLPIGLRLGLLVPRPSYVADELGAITRHFTDYGGFAYAVFDSPQIAYDDPNVAGDLIGLYKRFTHTSFSGSGEFWLNDMIDHAGVGALASKSAFNEALSQFLSLDRHAKYRHDVLFADDSQRVVAASKMLIRLRNVHVSNYSAVAATLRSMFADAGFAGFVYSPTFLLVDQQQSTVRNVVQNVCIALAVMVAVALLFIPRALSALWVGCSIGSINLGVVGGLSLWHVRLDIVTMITVVMSIGFSVDFASHITYHFLICGGSGRRRLESALRLVGVPILQSAASTALGIATLAPVRSYMVATFVKTVLLVVALGLVHALFFLPVLLSIVVPADDFLDDLTLYATRRRRPPPPPPTVVVNNKRMRCYFGRAPDDAQSQAAHFSAHHRRPVIRPQFESRAAVPRRASANLHDFLSHKCEQQLCARPKQSGSDESVRSRSVTTASTSHSVADWPLVSSPRLRQADGFPMTPSREDTRRHSISVISRPIQGPAAPLGETVPIALRVATTRASSAVDLRTQTVDSNGDTDALQHCQKTQPAPLLTFIPVRRVHL